MNESGLNKGTEISHREPGPCRIGFLLGELSSAPGRWIVLIFLLSLVLFSEVDCARRRTISRPPRISEQEKNERVFQTNEEAVEAGIYEEFVDSMLLKGLPGKEELPRRTTEVETPALEPAEVPAQGVPEAYAPEVLMGFRVQLGAFNDQEGAEKFVGRVRERISSYPVYIRYYHPLWKVQVGDCRTREEARRLRDILRGRGYPDAWVVESGIQR